MESKYPSPCLKCTRQSCKENGTQFRECREWLTWFRWWWKRFRSVLQEAPQGGTQTKAEKFCYSHPDHIKTYLKYSPCGKCAIEKNCDNPCKAYLIWYNERMKIIRKKVDL